ncbi:MAG: Mur ligase family protein [Lactobacillales bacterium]|jgi:UDP-N-acetylmuramoyl-L-alanyl-D-glutamate--2,6-diaminopimelate ligase|nr:Mur ligase family protein [Lactobacillales bacterium]
MSIRSNIAKIAGKSAQIILKNFFNRGSALPGKIALKIDPKILDSLAGGYEIIVVTGTNGKTLTTALVTKVIESEFGQVVTNPTGSNMQQGIVGTFLSAPKVKKGERKFAVLEIDEASLPKVTEFIKPSLFVFTNIFRDQMDRYGEIYTTYRMIVEGAAKSPQATILANGDSPIFNSLETVNKRIYYGFDKDPEHIQSAEPNTDGVLCPKCHHVLKYKQLVYANLGEYFCEHCDFHRPELDYKLTEIQFQDNNASEFTAAGVHVKMGVGGMYNIYNALAAVAVGKYYDIEPAKIAKALEYDERIFGRQETFEINGKTCTLVLVKNPVGLNQVIDMIELAPYEFTLASILNANYADGIDVSWIWDSHHEKFANMNISKAIAAGDRHRDMALRLEVAGIAPEKLVEVENFDGLVKEITSAPTDEVYILATYTAMLGLRDYLAEHKFIKGGMINE